MEATSKLSGGYIDRQTLQRRHKNSQKGRRTPRRWTMKGRSGKGVARNYRYFLFWDEKAFCMSTSLGKEVSRPGEYENRGKEMVIDGKPRVYKWERIKNLDGRICLETQKDMMTLPLRLKGKRSNGCRSK